MSSRRDKTNGASLSNNRQQSYSSLSSYKTQSISKHYALNDQILCAFDSLYEKQMYRGAYAFGIQYVEVALLEIPKHGYFYSARHKKERLENSENALRVTNQLLTILDQIEGSKPADWEHVRRFKALAEEQASEKDKLVEIYEKDRSEVEQELASSVTSLLCGDIMEYAEFLCPGGSNVDQPSEVPYQATSSVHSDLTTSSTTFNAMPTNLQSSEASSTDELQRALILSGIAAAEPSASVPPGHRRKRSATSIDMTSLSMCYHEDFDDLRHRGRIRVSQADTHQGRIEGSINGCTVIAPLLCLHHFMEDIDQGLPDAAVVEVIDCETPAILPQVRENLGLTKDALIIPSDVHDFLIDRQLLTSEQFVTVCGGNILDDVHIAEFVNQMLNPPGKDRNLAATFFFHEHVIAILRIQRSENELWFDLMDSLPHQETLRRCSQPPIDDDFYIPNASRIRCTTEEAFKATIRWYACSRFTDENRQYMDMYDWDEASSDFDPRVFQAFIWAENK